MIAHTGGMPSRTSRKDFLMSPATLFSPLQLGSLHLPHRVLMAPMTRARSDQPGDVPNALMAEYYASVPAPASSSARPRRSRPKVRAYSFTPGIFSEAQAQGWRLVTDAVHARGGRMFLQLWHVGRMSHERVFMAGMRRGAPAPRPMPRSGWWVRTAWAAC